MSETSKEIPKKTNKIINWLIQRRLAILLFGISMLSYPVGNIILGTITDGTFYFETLSNSVALESYLPTIFLFGIYLTYFSCVLYAVTKKEFRLVVVKIVATFISCVSSIQ